MSDTKSEIYLHLVWTTKDRQPLLSEPYRSSIHNCIAAQTKAAGARMLAVGGPADHVHIVVQMNTTTTVAEVAKQIKGISSLFAKDQLGLSALYWQSGFGALRVGRSARPTVLAYVQKQEQHHADGRIMKEWEAPDDRAGH